MSPVPSFGRRVAFLALMAPGIGFLALFFLWPMLASLIASFETADGGLSTLWYERIWTRNTYWRGFTTSIWYGVAPLPPTLALSIVLALLLRRSFVGRKLFNGLYKIPLAVPGIIVSLMVIVMAERGGFLDRLVAPLGLSIPKIVRDEWGVGVVLASSWKQVPFMALIITGAFAAIPEDISNAARSLGASRWRTFLFVEVPLAMPGITAAILLTFITSMGSYAIPDLVGPPNPRALSVIMVQLYGEGAFNQVYAMGMVLTLFAVLVLFAYYALTARIGLDPSKGRRT